MDKILVVAVIIMAISTIVDAICFAYENSKIRKMETALKIVETKVEDMKHDRDRLVGVIFDNYEDIKKLHEILTKLQSEDEIDESSGKAENNA